MSLSCGELAQALPTQTQAVRIDFAPSPDIFDAVKDSFFYTKLPFEIRQEIFQLVFDEIHIAKGHVRLPFQKFPAISPEGNEEDPFELHEANNSPKPDPHKLALLLVCKTIYSEVLPIIHSTSVLQVLLTRACVPEPPMPKTNHLRKIRYLELLIVDESPSAINYLRYLGCIEKPKLCHVRISCGLPCERRALANQKSREGFYIENLIDEIGMRTKFVTALVKFLWTFKGLVLSYGPVQPQQDDGPCSFLGPLCEQDHACAIKKLGQVIVNKHERKMRGIPDLGKFVSGDRAPRAIFIRQDKDINRGLPTEFAHRFEELEGNAAEFIEAVSEKGGPDGEFDWF